MEIDPQELADTARYRTTEYGLATRAAPRLRAHRRQGGHGGAVRRDHGYPQVPVVFLLEPQSRQAAISFVAVVIGCRDSDAATVVEADKVALAVQFPAGRSHPVVKTEVPVAIDGEIISIIALASPGAELQIYDTLVDIRLEVRNRRWAA